MPPGSNRGAAKPDQVRQNGASGRSLGNSPNTSQPRSQQPPSWTPSTSNLSSGSNQNTPNANPTAFTGPNTRFVSQRSNGVALNNSPQSGLQTNPATARSTAENIFYENMSGGTAQDVISGPGYTGRVDRTVNYTDLGPPFESPNAYTGAPHWNPDRPVHTPPPAPCHPPGPHSSRYNTPSPLDDRDTRFQSSRQARNGHPSFGNQASNGQTGVLTNDPDVDDYYYRNYVAPSNPRRSDQG